MSERAGSGQDNRIVSLFRRGVNFENLLVGLAWLGEANTEHVARLWLPGYSQRHVQRILRELMRDEYIERRYWHIARANSSDGTRLGPLRQAVLWSLTKKGREMVREVDTYPPASLAPRHRKLLAHDTQTYELLVRMIELAQPIGLSGVYIEREVKLDPPRRRPIMDALISLRFGGTELPTNVVPWTKDPHDTTEDRRRYAIENDRDSEAISVIKAKADAYIAAGTPQWFAKYERPFPVPVWLVPSERRLRAILHAWQEVWPSGRWLMTTDAGLRQDQWVYYQRGKVVERPLFRGDMRKPSTASGSG